MKKIITMLAVVTSTVSFQAKALDVIAVMSTSAGLLTSSEKRCQEGGCNKEAMQIIEDGQDYHQSGKLSLFLEAEVKKVQAEHQDMSVDEAVDALTEDASSLLN